MHISLKNNIWSFERSQLEENEQLLSFVLNKNSQVLKKSTPMTSMMFKMKIKNES